MTWATWAALYVTIWWTALFVVLPWGIQTPDNPMPGTAASAPVKPRMWLKAGITTGLSAVIWLGIYITSQTGLISFRDWAAHR